MEKYIDMLIKAGACRAETIRAEDVVTAPWTIFKCKYGCPTYGKSRCCPPVAPTWKETREILDSFERGILFCSHDVSVITPAAIEVSRELFLDGYYKAIAFGSGECRKCARCNLERCNFPGTTLPTMEGCGIDVYATARGNGFNIDPVRDREEEPNYFGLIMED